MKKSTFLAWILRMPLIKRWALMHTVKRENIAEHSHQVAVIAHLLATIRNVKFNGELNCEKIATIALYHEVSESKLQDLNHVTKYHNPEITREFKKLEKLCEQECLNSLPVELQAIFSDMVVQENVDPEYKKLIKCADIISAYFKASDEIRFGNHEFIPVKERLTTMLMAFEESNPEIKYFMEVFSESCFVSVDDLSRRDQ